MRRNTLLLLLAGLVCGLLLPASSSARTINVHAGQSIQRERIIIVSHERSMGCFRPVPVHTFVHHIRSARGADNE